MKIDIKDSRVYNIGDKKELKLAEKIKERFNNSFKKVETIVVGLDKIIIRGSNIIE